jgi:hypothetical protein
MEKTSMDINKPSNLEDDTTKKGRPVLVWIISIFLGWSALSALFVDAMGLFYRVPSEAILQHQIPSLAWLDHVFTWGMNILLLIAVVSLFRLQARALPLFAAYIAGVLLIQVWSVLTTDWLTRYGLSGGILNFAVGIGIFVLIFVYIVYLRKQGRLV